MNDLAFAVPDLDAEADRLVYKGVPVLCRSAVGQTCYFDTRAEGNIMLRLVQS